MLHFYLSMSSNIHLARVPKVSLQAQTSEQMPCTYLGEYVLHVTFGVITVYMYSADASCFPAVIQIAVRCGFHIPGAIVQSHIFPVVRLQLMQN